MKSLATAAEPKIEDTVFLHHYREGLIPERYNRQCLVNPRCSRIHRPMGTAHSADSTTGDHEPGTTSVTGYDSDSEYHDAHSEIMVPTPPLPAVVPRTAEAEGAI